MRKQFIIAATIFLLTIPGISMSGSFHFGIISSVKGKVEEIKEEKEKDKLPSVAITAFAGGSTVSGIVTITTEAVNSVKVEFYMDGVLKATDTTEPYSYILDTTQYANGIHTIEAKAYSTNNQTASSKYSITITNDTPPVITIISIAGNPTLSGIVSITADASDDKGIVKVEFSIDCQ